MIKAHGVNLLSELKETCCQPVDMLLDHVLGSRYVREYSRIEKERTI